MKMKHYTSQTAVWICVVLLIGISNFSNYVAARKHNLHLANDTRRLIHITSFGFFKGGFMEVTVHEIRLEHGNFAGKDKENKQIIGFTVDRTLKDGINPYPHDVETTCALTSKQAQDESTSSILFALDLANKNVKVDCSPSLGSNVRVYKTTASLPFAFQAVPRQFKSFGNIMTQPQRRKRNAADSGSNVNGNADGSSNIGSSSNLEQGGTISKSNSDLVPAEPAMNNLEETDKVPEKKLDILSNSGKSEMGKEGLKETPLDSTEDSDEIEKNFKDPAQPDAAPLGSCSNPGPIPLNATMLPQGITSYSFSFVVYIAGEDCEGLYNLYFHNCAEDYGSVVTLNVSLVEENLKKNFLSAGEMPLPALYFMMSVLFFMTGCFWMFILKKSKKENGVSVFKIHYLMGALVFIKSLSLLFHSINYHFIQTEGTPAEGWAVLYYITHLLKGALLFITILLIGTGYAFVKHILSDKDKKIFMIVIPLQVLANVAQIIIEESEEGEVVHTTWQVIFISVDLLCCCAILVPVVWSIRHLQEASQTDGKAATNLRKLKLFRHFYIIIVCYIYFTRIIVQMLLKITVPFQYEWLDDMCREMTTFIFFVLTGYKFRPAANNPYLELAHDSEDEEMDTVITDSGLTEGVVKRGYKPKKKTLKEIVLYDPNEEETDDDEEVLLEKRREASHDLD